MMLYKYSFNLKQLQYFDRMQCPMCYDLYDHTHKIPRNLNCGHTACEQCLNISYDKKKMLECPTCRFKHEPQIKVSLLTKNYIALQLASQKRQIQNNHQFCQTHDQPLKFHCQDCKSYICVECITDHSGHRFCKQDQNFFAAKKSLSQQITRLDQERKVLLSNHNSFEYVKKQMICKYEESVNELDQIFKIINQRLIDQQYKQKEEIRKFFEKEMGLICQKEKEILQDLQFNDREKNRIIALLQKIQTQKKVNDTLSLSSQKIKDYKKPSVVEFPVCISPFTTQESFVQVFYKATPKICFFGERKKLLTLCPITGVYTLTTITNAQIQYYGSACTIPTGQIIITGGGSQNSCHLFNPKNPNMLKRKKNMMHARKQHSCIYLKGYVYVISGYDGKNKGMAGCEAYDIFKEEWSTIKSLNIPRCAFAATVCNGKIYIFGGYDGKDRLNSIEVYNPQTNKWNQLQVTLKFPLSNAAAVAEGKYIYIFGGGWSEGFNQQIFRFDTQNHQFESYEKMQKGRDLRNKAIKFKNQIFAIGGNFYDGEKLDLRLGKWQELKAYNDLVNDNLDSWCCALSYDTHQYELQKYQHLKKTLKKKAQQSYNQMSSFQKIE